MRRGLFLGTFMPPHAGHAMLAETARTLVDELTILVCWSPGDPIPGPLRLTWMRELFPWARMIGHAAGEAFPAGEDQASAHLLRGIGDVHPQPIDLLFASETLGAKLAQHLGARWIMVDPERAAVPVSAGAIRADPFAHWHYLATPARPFYARTICLHGPESTGKSTLAPKLARHFGTCFVPEYGRTYCAQHGLSLSMDDLVAIGRVHAAMTRSMLRQCNRRLFLDTDPLMTAIWADMLFGTRDRWFDAFDRTADLYLLLDIDVPWVDDGTRFFGGDHERRRFFDLSRDELERRGLAYRIIGGPPDERFARALAAIADAGL